MAGVLITIKSTRGVTLESPSDIAAVLWMPSKERRREMYTGAECWRRNRAKMTEVCRKMEVFCAGRQGAFVIGILWQKLVDLCLTLGDIFWVFSLMSL